MRECCEDLRNRIQKESFSICSVCGLRHYEMNAEPGNLRAILKGLEPEPEQKQTVKLHAV